MIERLAGTWRLVSFVARDMDGRETHTYGANPAGVLMYDTGGRMSVQLARTDEPKEGVDGYFGYFGRYTVDQRAGTVTHHVEGSSDPGIAGTDQRRIFALQDDRLVLSTPPGAEMTYVATWERQT